MNTATETKTFNSELAVFSNPNNRSRQTDGSNYDPSEVSFGGMGRRESEIGFSPVLDVPNNTRTVGKLAEEKPFAQVAEAFRNAVNEAGNFLARRIFTKEVVATGGAIVALTGFSTPANAGIDQNGNIAGGASIASSLTGVVGTTQLAASEGYQNTTFQWETIAPNFQAIPTRAGRAYISEISFVAAVTITRSSTQVPVSSVNFNLLEYTPGNIMEGRLIPLNDSALAPFATVTETAIPGLFGSTTDGRTLQLSKTTIRFSSATSEMNLGNFFNTDKPYSYAIGASGNTGSTFQTFIFNPNAALVENGANVTRTQRAVSGGTVMTFGVNGEGGADIKFLSPGAASVPEAGSLPLFATALLTGMSVVGYRRLKESGNKSNQ